MKKLGEFDLNIYTEKKKNRFIDVKFWLRENASDIYVFSMIIL